MARPTDSQSGLVVKLTIGAVVAALALIASGSVLPACALGEQQAKSPGDADVARPAAVARLEPLGGSEVEGTVTFTECDGGLHVVAEITGLSAGEHGFHIHEKGDCSASDGSSAGAHWNPGSDPHGSPEAEPRERHLGDLGNISADTRYVATFDHIVEGLALDGEDSIIGRSLILHESEDDYATQPSGNAGKPIACGVIEAVD